MNTEGFAARLGFLVCLFSMVAISASAQNQIGNAEFTTDITSGGWLTTGAGTASWDGTSGHPAPGSARLVAGVSQSVTLYQCVTVTAPNLVDFGARTFTNNSSGSESHTIETRFFDGASCSGNDLGTASTSLSSLGGGWFQWAAANVTVPASTQSAQLELTVSLGAAGSADITFDHAYFGPPGTVPVTLLGFQVE